MLFSDALCSSCSRTGNPAAERAGSLRAGVPMLYVHARGRYDGGQIAWAPWGCCIEVMMRTGSGTPHGENHADSDGVVALEGSGEGPGSEGGWESRATDERPIRARRRPPRDDDPQGSPRARSRELPVVGEIQIHDRRLFEFKQRLHRLYTVARASSIDQV